jgi:hypothetical protein
MDKKAWEGEVFEQQEPKYYIVKNKENWEFSIAVKGLEKTLNEKGHLARLIEFMEIDKDDVVMVSENNVKHLPTTCIEFTKWVNDNINIKIDKEGLATCYHYRKDVIETLTKHDKFKKLPADNEFKTFINKISDCLAKNLKFTKIDCFLKDSYNMRSGNPIKYKGSKVLELIISRVGTYNWSVDEMLLIVENLK